MFSPCPRQSKDCINIFILWIMILSTLHNTARSLSQQQQQQHQRYGNSDSERELLRTVTGRIVPRSYLTQFMPVQIAAQITEHHLFEISHNRYLHSPSLYTKQDLLSSQFTTATYHQSALSEQHEASIHIDGKQTTIKTSVKVYVGAHFTTIVDAIDDEIIHVFSARFNLIPLGSDYPGIFFNSAHMEHAKHVDDTTLINAQNAWNFGQVINSSNIPVTHSSTESKNYSLFIQSFQSDSFASNEDDHNDFGSTMSSSSVAQSSSTCRSKSPQRIFELALAFDSFYCKRYSGIPRKAVSALFGLTLAASLPYEKDTCITLKVVHIDGFCSNADDPYGKYVKFEDGARALRAFKNYWIKNRKTVHRDVAILFTGYDDGTTLLGVAYQGYACTTELGYGVVELANAPVYAHELGHTLNCEHVQYGIMKEFYGKNTLFKFSKVSLNQIFDFMDSKPLMSGCITTTQTPTPTPKPELKKCISGFSSSRVLLCRTFRIGEIPVQYGVIRIRVTVAFNVVQIEFAPNYLQIKMYKVRSFISLRSDLLISEIGPLYASKKGFRLGRQRWTMNDLNMPIGKNTCCGVIYYVYVWTFTCATTRFAKCQRDYLVEPFTLPCKNVCATKPGMKTLPMSTHRKCPTCQ